MIESETTNNDIKHIMLTGGPGGGKSSVINHLHELAVKEQYRSFVVPESASQIILDVGLNELLDWMKNNPSKRDVVNREIWLMQLHNERKVLELAKLFDGRKVVFYDRGILDSKVYMGQDNFKKMLKEFNLNEDKIKSRYDAIFHLQTSAYSDSYKQESNPARLETVEEALIADERTFNAWANKNNHFLIEAVNDFNEKIHSLQQHVLNILNDK